MKQIILVELWLRNFKGCKSFLISPDRKRTNVAGDNGTGKSTLADAPVWLLWGKDLQDRKDYNIKTLDSQNNPIHQLEHEVGAIFDVDGERVSCQRIYKEKWVKPRGKEETELQGHETILFWNEVPKKASEFSTLVSETFGDEQVFKMLTNPLFFNMLAWKQRRTILEELTDKVSDLEVAKGNERLQALLDKVTNKSLEDYHDQVKRERSKLQKELDTIPIRMDELDRTRPAEEPDYKLIEAEIERLEKEIADIDLQLEGSSGKLQLYHRHKEAWLNQIEKAKDEIREIERLAQEQALKDHNAYNNRVYVVKQCIEALKRTIKGSKDKIAEYDKEAEELVKRKDILAQQLQEEEKKDLEVPENALICPMCDREHESHNIEEIMEKLISNFNKTQAQAIERLRKSGEEIIQRLESKAKAKAGELESLEADTIELEKKKEELTALESNPVAAKDIALILEANPLHKQKQLALKEIEENPILPPSDSDNTELKERKKRLLSELTTNKDKLKIKDQVATINKRMAELQEQEKDLSRKIAVLDREEFSIEEFNRTKIDLIESRINKLFPTARFKMFDYQLNGGFKECCETLVNGVPFDAANTAARIQTGLEIINVLQKHYDFALPIWIDNRESVSTIPDINGQVINLFKIREHKKLTILDHHE